MIYNVDLLGGLRDLLEISNWNTNGVHRRLIGICLFAY